MIKHLYRTTGRTKTDLPRRIYELIVRNARKEDRATRGKEIMALLNTSGNTVSLHTRVLVEEKLIVKTKQRRYLPVDVNREYTNGIKADPTDSNIGKDVTIRRITGWCAKRKDKSELITGPIVGKRNGFYLMRYLGELYPLKEEEI